jgi:drug/metabolite transporter (DMT)-like permease
VRGAGIVSGGAIARDAPSPLAAVVTAASASLFFGGMVFSTRFVIGQTDAWTLAFLRFGIGAACLAPIAFRRRTLRLERADRIPIACLGIAGYGAMSVLLGAGLRLTYASRGALILTSQSLLTLLFSCWRGEERFTRAKLVGTGLAACGLALAVSRSTSAPRPTSGAWTGDLLVFGAAVCISVYNVYSRPYLRRYSPMAFTALTMAAAGAALLPLAVGIGVTRGLPTLTPAGGAAVIYIGVFGAAIGYGLWVWALKQITPTRVAVCLALNPLSATVLGAVLLGEPITPRFIVGFLLVASGIVVTNLPEADQARRRRPTPSLEP